MPTITGPDGRKLRVPEGADPAVVQQTLRQVWPDAAWGDAPAAAAPSFNGVRSSVDTTADRTDDNTVAQDMSRGERFAAGMGQAFSGIGRGIYQSGVDAANRSTGIATSALRGIGADSAARALAENVGIPLNREARQIEQDTAELRRLDEAGGLNSDGYAIGGNVTGNLVSLLGPGIAARGTAAGAMLLPRTITGNAMLGASLGALQPNTGASDQAQNTALGGLLGGAGAALPRVVGVGGSYVGRLFDGVSPLERRAGARILESATDPNALRFDQSAVPGVQRTLGEETLDPGVMRLERLARQADTNVFQPQDASNNAARQQFIEAQGLSQPEYAAQQQARTSAAQSARDEAVSAGPADVSGTVSQLDDLIVGQEGRPAIQNGLRQVRALLARDTAVDGLTVTEPRTGDINQLDNIRQTISDLLSGKFGGDSAAALQGSRELIGLRDSLNQEIGDQIPAFTRYLDAYRNGSRDINRTDIWRELSDRSSNVPDAETGFRNLTPDQFFRATNDLDTLAARGTDFAKARAEDIFNPSDFKALAALGDDLSRVQKRQLTSATGSPTSGLQQQFARQAGQRIAGALGPFGAPIQAIVGSLEDATQQKLAYLLANPREAERVLRALPKKDADTLRLTLNRLVVASGGQATRSRLDGP